MQLRIESDSMVSASPSLLDVIDHACTMEKLHREVYKGSKRRALHQGSCNAREFFSNIGSGS